MTPLYNGLADNAALRWLRAHLATETWCAALILFALLNFCFFRCMWGNRSLLESAQDCPSIFLSWSGDRVLDPTAAAWFSEPYLALTGHDLFREKTLPLWNPYQGFGVPLLANTWSQSFYPLTLAFSVHPSPRSYSWFLLLRLYLAGICAYFFLRLFVSFIPSLTGGITSMLAGYYLLYIPASHLSVEVLLPAGFLAAECLLRRQTYGRLVWFSIVVFLCLAGGMPESTFLLLAVVSLYVIFRLSSDTELLLTWRKVTKYVLGGTFAGISLAAFLMLPFLEYLRCSFNGHESSSVGFVVGLLHDPFDRYVLTYIFPLLYGPPAGVRFNFDFTGLRNFVGLLEPLLMLIAALSLFGVWTKRNKTLNTLTMFFSALVMLIFVKQYGWAPINSIGRLPLFSLIHFPKYDEPILSISVSIVGAIGLEKLIRREVRISIQMVAVGLSFLVLLLAAFLSRGILISRVWGNPIPVNYQRVAIALPACLLFFLSIALFCSQRAPAIDTGRKRIDTNLAVWICLLVTAEATLNFVIPLYSHISPPPLRSKNPYAGAPYIDFLRSKSSDNYRVFAKDGILTADWPSAFQLYDIRDADALYPQTYFPFVRNFLPPSKARFPDLNDKFTGLDEYPLQTVLQRRLLQLSSVKYVAAAHAFHNGVDGTAGKDVPFDLIYNHEAKIYEYRDVLPRAGIFFRADIQASDADALRKLRDPSFDIFKTVVVAAPDLDEQETKELAKVNGGRLETVEAAKILSYKSQLVDIEASADRNAILVLNDTGFPGWTVKIDGRPGKWFKADYMFRAVLLTPGRHSIRFAYRPLSFYLGACISLASLACLVIAGWFNRSKRNVGRIEKAVTADHSA